MVRKVLTLLLLCSLLIPLGYVNFGVNAVVYKGMDISEWQDDINWDLVKTSDIKFTFIRTSGRFVTRRTFYEDSKFRRNAEGATRIGMPKGAYHYCAALNVSDALKEADYFVSKLNLYKWELPVCLDMESNDALNSLSYEMRTKIAMVFLESVARRGYKPMLYTNLNWANNMLDIKKVQTKFPVWIAQYHDHCDYNKGPLSFWQFTSSGTVPGIHGRVDLDYAYTNIPVRR